MKITILVENTSSGEYCGEHGLCAFIEHGGRSYLLDTGASGLFAENAARAGVDLSRVDTAFLSHAHYDHSGGYAEFFEKNRTAKVYLQEACRSRYYFKIAGPIRKYIGIPENIPEQYADRFVYVDGYRDLGDGVHLCPHTTPGLAKRGEHAHMYCVTGKKTVVDDFSHEQTIVFEEPDGLVLFNSCSHGGVENIVEEAKRQFPGREIKAFFGGFHMMGVRGVDTCSFSEQEVRGVAHTLLRSSNAVFYTGHCTGNVAGKWLREEMGERFIPLCSGMTVTL